jgi:hypothetical protein
LKNTKVQVLSVTQNRACCVSDFIISSATKKRPDSDFWVAGESRGFIWVGLPRDLVNSWVGYVQLLPQEYL